MREFTFWRRRGGGKGSEGVYITRRRHEPSFPLSSVASPRSRHCHGPRQPVPIFPVPVPPSFLEIALELTNVFLFLNCIK